MEVKDLLKEKRIASGLTMLELSKLVGVSEGTISRWESGEIANMKRDKILSLAKALHISPADIMGWDDMYHQSGLQLSGLEKTVISSYRKADDLTKQMVHRVLGIEEVKPEESAV